MFLVLLGVSAVLSLVGLPVGNDAQLTAVVKELSLFSRAFDQEKLEDTLLEMAQVQNRTTVSDVVAKLRGEGLPTVVGDKSAVITSLAALDLTTLEAVHRHSAADASLDIASVKPEIVATSLSWRLARLGADKRITITGIELAHANVSETQTAREAEVFEARQKMLGAQRTAAQAEKAHTAADDTYRARLKWGGHWKVINRANEKRQEARLESIRRTKRAAAVSEQFAALEKKALAFKGGAKGGNPSMAIARVSLKVDGKPSTIEIPVVLDVRTVTVPPLSASAFPEAHQSGMWSDIKTMTPKAALAKLEAQFSWHQSGTGTSMLHALPLVLPILLLMLVLRIRAVSNGYSPFNSDGQGDLPKVGLGVPVADALLVATLPATACGLCAWSLIAIGQVPTVPAISAVASIALGIWSFPHLRELRSMTVNIERSRTAPPPPGGIRD